ncbi:GNAT family N-acetyltransferase [Streptomyces sp. NPDC056773]|uniref:GNAT family N-acetyltransferase n=1 Tax=unclassified Streptomyces TaxID=2593676 RepID=UPI0036BAA8B4
MHSTLDRVTGYEEILRRVGDNPYTRMAMSRQSTAYATAAGAVAWFTPTPWASLVSLHGDEDAAEELFVRLSRAGLIPAGAWLRVLLPAQRFHRIPGIRLREEWQFRWIQGAPPQQQGEDDVVRIPAARYDELEELLREGNPDTVVRARGQGIHGWYGIREAGRLVACGADRSLGGVGYLAAITVRPDCRRRGLGTAVTTAMTRRLASTTGAVALGVNTGNRGAIDLYERLGFRESVELATFQVAGGEGRPASGSTG